MKFSLCLWFAAMIFAIVYGRWRISQFDHLPSTTPRLRVAVVQTDVPQSIKNQPTDALEQLSFNRLLKLNERAAVTDPQLIVWPETVVPRAINDEMVRIASDEVKYLAGQLRQSPGKADLQTTMNYWASIVRYRKQVRQAAIDSNAYLVVGANANTDWRTGRPAHRYNSAYYFGPDGSLVGRYDKIHRVPFGEYMLFQTSLPWLHRLLLKLTPFDFDYSLTAGHRFTVFNLPVGHGTKQVVWRMAAPICFEDAFSRVCRRMVYDASGKRADILMNLTNDGWYPGSAEAIQHEQLARFRCIENRVPMARAVNRGVSGVFDSVGRRIATVIVGDQRQLVRGVAVAEVVRDDRLTWFGQHGNVFAVGCGIVTVLLLALSVLLPRHRGHEG